MFVSVDVGRRCSLLTSVIILVSLCEPVAGKTQQALHFQHVMQKKRQNLCHTKLLLNTATVLETLKTKYIFMAQRSLSIIKCAVKICALKTELLSRQSR